MHIALEAGHSTRIRDLVPAVKLKSQHTKQKEKGNQTMVHGI